MTYGYQGFWSEIQPIFGSDPKKVLYWQYKIFTQRSNRFLFGGNGMDRASVLACAEQRIDALVHASATPRAA
jgi:hypothetical protein